jgi:hypothetical protein
MLLDSIRGGPRPDPHDTRLVITVNLRRAITSRTVRSNDPPPKSPVDNPASRICTCAVLLLFSLRLNYPSAEGELRNLCHSFAARGRAPNDMTAETPPFTRDDLVTLHSQPERGVYKVVSCEMRERNWWVVGFRVTPRRTDAGRGGVLFHGPASQLEPCSPARASVLLHDRGDGI